MRQHWNALSLAAWAVSCLAYGEPPLFGLSELDIVFPRQGETYAVLDPFPVIFAMQDAPPIFSNEFEIEYSILACRTCPGYQSTQAYQSDMSFMYGNQNASFVDHPVPNGTVYFGETTSSFSAGPWLLSWSLAVSCACTSFFWITCLGYPMKTVANGTITFTLNQASTTLPAIASGCPEFAGMMRFEGTLARSDVFTAATDATDGCIITVTPSPSEARPCSASIDPDHAASIWETMSVVVQTASSTSTLTATTQSKLMTTAAPSTTTLTSTVTGTVSPNSGDVIMAKRILNQSIKIFLISALVGHYLL